MYYANSVFVCFFLFLFKGSSKCGFFHLAVLFRFYRVLFLHHVFLYEQIKMMMMIAGCVFQALTGQAPAYLPDDCRLISVSDRRKLRSSDIRTCVIPRTSTRFGDSFSAAGPQVWNGLPSALRLRTLHLTVSNDSIRPICLHWCDEISAPSDYWLLALYKYSSCTYGFVCKSWFSVNISLYLRNDIR